MTDAGRRRGRWRAVLLSIPLLVMVLALGGGLARLPGLRFWADLSQGLQTPARIGGVELSEAPVSLVYVAKAGELYYEPAEGTPKIWRSGDGARSWRPVERSAVQDVLDEARSQDQLLKYVRDLVRSGQRLYFATDLGLYALLPSGEIAPLAGFENETVQALHVRDHTLYAKTPSGLWALPLGDDEARRTPLEDRYPRYLLQEAAAFGAFVLGLGLFLLGFDLMLLRPSGLGWGAAPGVVRTGAWRPLLAGESFRAYRERVALPLRSPLERLLLLGAFSCFNRPRTTEGICRALRDRGIEPVPTAAEVRRACRALAREGLLVEAPAGGGGLRPAEPRFHELLRRRERAAFEEAARAYREGSPLALEVLPFLREAFRGHSLRIKPAGSGLLVATAQPLYRKHGEIYAEVCCGSRGSAPPITSREVEEFAHRAREALPSGSDTRLALLVLEGELSYDARLELAACRARPRGPLAILPLGLERLREARARGPETCRQVLDHHYRLYVGRSNLYDMRDPVSGLFFFGRTRLLEELRELLLRHRRPLGIFGLRKMGKSSLARRLQERLGREALVARVDLQECGGADCAWVYLQAVAGFEQDLRSKFPARAEVLTQGPLELSRWDHKRPWALREAEAAFVRDVLRLRALLEPDGEGEVVLVLLLDEVSTILPPRPKAGYEELLTLLRGLHQQRGFFVPVLLDARSRVNRAGRWEREREGEGGDNPIQAYLREVFLGPLDPPEAEEMVRALGALMGLEYGEGAVEHLVEQTGGHPFLTRLVCARLADPILQGKRPSGRIARADVEAQLRIFGRQSPNVWSLDLGAPEFSPAHRQILRELAEAPGQDGRDKDEDKDKDKDWDWEALQELLEWHLVAETAPGSGRYRLTIPLLGEQIRRRGL